MDRRDLAIIFVLGGIWGAATVITWNLGELPAWLTLVLAVGASSTVVAYMKVRSEVAPAPALRVRIPRLTVAREATHPVPPDLRKTIQVKVPRAQRMTWRERRQWRRDHPVRIPVPPVPAGAQ